MYKVEYLLLLESDKAKCKTVKALKSLLGADSDIEIEKDKIHYKGYTAVVDIKLGKSDNTSHLFFDILLRCDSEANIDKFSGLLRAVRGSINLLSKTNYVIWDDLSLFYSQKAYPVIFEIENLMRQLITKFMLANIGVGWTKDRVPTDVQQSINPNNKDINYLNNVDFIQLKNFLFSENYPNHKESLIQKLKGAKDLSNLNLDEIKSLLPDSNWSKYFEPLVGCDAEYLKKRWDKIYDLRCSVAHNKPFDKSDLESVILLASELKPHLLKALTSLDKIVIDESEREDLAENVVITFDNNYSEFILLFRQLEGLVYDVYKYVMNADDLHVMYFMSQIKFLLDKGVVSDMLYETLAEIYRVRNNIVHNTGKIIEMKQLRYVEAVAGEMIKILRDYLDFAQNKKVV